MAKGPRRAAGSKGTDERAILRLGGARVDVERHGRRGPPLLLLQSEEAYEARLPLVAELARRRRVYLPWAPGYGRSPLPDGITTIDDVAYLWLDLLEHYDLRGVTVLGFSVGGWIAAEMATKSCERIDRLVLVCPVGAKFGGAYDRDIADIYYLPDREVRALKFHDPALDPLADMTALGRAGALAVAKHRETTARLCWEPYFHDPALAGRLHRIRCETLVVWGAADGFVRPAYGRKLARRIPGARLVSIPRAGHYPHIERPAAFADALAAFLDSGRQR